MGELAIHLIFPNMPKLNVDGMRRKNEKKKPKIVTNMVNWWYSVPWKSTQFHLVSSYTLALWIGKGIVMSAFTLHNDRGPKCSYTIILTSPISLQKNFLVFDGKISCLKMAKELHLVRCLENTLYSSTEIIMNKTRVMFRNFALRLV